jgi:tRNA pseudouridine13 synthase
MNFDLPFSTVGFAPIPGAIKERYEDFQVEEVPAYEPCGNGDHVYFTVEKKGLSTARAIRDIARKIGVNPRDIGAAGMNDARGITRQTLSVEHADPERIAGLEIPRIRILRVSRHGNKLRIGHLRGNKFVIKLRDADPRRIGDVLRLLEIFTERGAPNYFGSQRFGIRGDTWRVGQALLKDDFKEAVHIIAGRPGPEDIGQTLRARELFEAGRYSESARAWPRGFEEGSILCSAMERFRGDFKRAAFSLNRKVLGIYVSACQSRLFNMILAERIDHIDELEEGDLAWKHDSGAVFPVETLSAEMPRAKRFEISATGPLFGPKMKSPNGRPRDLELEALRRSEMTLESFSKTGPLKCPGGRRALRFKPVDPIASSLEDEVGAYIELRFTLQPGCYATSIIREICKDKLIEMDGVKAM